MNDEMDILDYLEALEQDTPAEHAPGDWRALGDTAWQREQQVDDG
jgi:hypothetical protein